MSKIEVCKIHGVHYGICPACQAERERDEWRRKYEAVARELEAMRERLNLRNSDGSVTIG